MNSLKILIVDDEKRIRDELYDFLTENGYEVYLAGLPSEALNILQNSEIDILILDIKLPEMDGLTLLEKVKSEYQDIEVIMITAHGNMDSVIKAMRRGAFDFFQKPFRLIDVLGAIERTKKYIMVTSRLKEAELNYSLVSKELKKIVGHPIIGESEEIKNLVSMMGKVAKSDTTSVMITGESGTGKELAARGIHLLSSRKNKYFQCVNCSSIPDNLFESEFFGYKKGAFTGAYEDKIGWFEISDKGTLFLDEIGDMPIQFQAKLLRVIEDRQVRRIGGNKEHPIDIRIVSATNQNLEKMIENSTFRKDLYYRLNTFKVHIPPLRERKEDIPLLIDYYLKYFSDSMKKRIKKIDSEIYLHLSNHNFPGNVRELKNLIERAVILCEGNKLSMNHFPEMQPNKEPEDKRSDFDLEENEKKLITKALEYTKNNKSKAAELLNITWQSLNRRIKRHNIKL